MYSMKDFRPWSHVSTRTTDGNYLKRTFTSPSRKDDKKKIKKEQKKMAIAKIFILQQQSFQSQCMDLIDSKPNS